MAHTKVSVIIPTLNAAIFLKQLVTRLYEQDHTPDQIIIIDSGSTDQTESLARSLNVDFIKIKSESFDHGATRNIGAEHSVGDILVYMTQDALPFDNETIGRLVKPLQGKGVVISYARQISSADASPLERYLREATYPPFSIIKSAADIKKQGIKTFQNSNVCAAYRRNEFETLGRFPSPVVCNEDMLFSAKAIFAGYKVVYKADALVLHTHQLNSKQLFRRYFDVAASLDNEPRIRTLGQIEAKGFDFLKNQLSYLRKQKMFYKVPRLFIDSTAKYLGYKAGEQHYLFPKRLKKYLGSNNIYWRKLEE